MFEKFGLRHPFFRPLGRRVVTTGAMYIWTALEFWGGHTGWGAFVALVATVCTIEFFVQFDAKNYGDDDV